MKTVHHILDTKPQPLPVYSVAPDCSVLDALQVMMEKNISALLVMEGAQLLGIFTERDYARKIILRGRSSRETPIRMVMTEHPFVVTPKDSIDRCMQLMTEKHIRHLPVVQEGAVAGMISIGDVVKFIIEDQRQTISHLENYINS
ncbi:CBS domain-containing protein [Compostibacter hankyongensis]|uniref:CBS domain-containing protein n=1 Tax=Compostibacter hankyongensis TaxID=1007089 RepID=A0ABP8FJ15_9BACT